MYFFCEKRGTMSEAKKLSSRKSRNEVEQLNTKGSLEVQSNIKMISPRASCLGLCPFRLSRFLRMETPQLSRPPVFPLSQKPKHTKLKQKPLFLMCNLLCLNLHLLPLVLFLGTTGDSLAGAALSRCFCTFHDPPQALGDEQF